MTLSHFFWHAFKNNTVCLCWKKMSKIIQMFVYKAKFSDNSEKKECKMKKKAQCRGHRQVWQRTIYVVGCRFANLWWSLCWAMTCFHQQFVTVNPFCAMFYLLLLQFSRSILGFLLNCSDCFAIFVRFVSPGWSESDEFWTVFMWLVLSYCFQKIFFILIVSFLCQSDLMNVIRR